METWIDSHSLGLRVMNHLQHPPLSSGTPTRHIAIVLVNLPVLGNPLVLCKLLLLVLGEPMGNLPVPGKPLVLGEPMGEPLVALEGCQSKIMNASCIRSPSFFERRRLIGTRRG